MPATSPELLALFDGHEGTALVCAACAQELLANLDCVVISKPSSTQGGPCQWCDTSYTTRVPDSEPRAALAEARS